MLVRTTVPYHVEHYVDYLFIATHVLMYHSSRSMLLTEIPSSASTRGEHAISVYHDGSSRCIAVVAHHICSYALPATPIQAYAWSLLLT